jgi:hypothetical protein
MTQLVSKIESELLFNILASKPTALVSTPSAAEMEIDDLLREMELLDKPLELPKKPTPPAVKHFTDVTNIRIPTYARKMKLNTLIRTGIRPTSNPMPPTMSKMKETSLQMRKGRISVGL